MSEIIKKENLPKHIAITMDGNGRWAKEKGQNRIFGHKQGIKACLLYTSPSPRD